MDLMVIVGENESYKVGQKVTFNVLVSGSKVAVVLRKVL